MCVCTEGYRRGTTSIEPDDERISRFRERGRYVKRLARIGGNANACDYHPARVRGGLRRDEDDDDDDVSTPRHCNVETPPPRDVYDAYPTVNDKIADVYTHTRARDGVMGGSIIKVGV